MHDLAFIIVTYVALIIGCMGLGYCGRWAVDAFKAHRARRISAARIAFDDAFPIIDEWAGRERWYLESPFLRRIAEIEHMRLLRDEPGLTIEQNLARVAANVREKYPAAFQTLH